MNEVYRISHKMPNWLRAEFADVGIPIEFKYEELTDEQKFTVAFLTEIYKLVEDGILEVIFDPTKDSVPRYRLKQKEAEE